MLEPRIVERGTFFVAGVTAAGQLGEFNYSEIWEKQYMPMDAVLKTLSLDGGCYGATFPEGDHLVYLAGVAVSENPELPSSIEKRVIPAATYAVFDCLMSTMNTTVQEVYGEWFYASDFELDTNALGFEYYLPYNGQGEMRVEIHIPVRPKVPVAIKQAGVSLSVFEAITNRRSIRKYKSDPVPEEIFRRILQAGMLAPSGMNRQPWKFYVVQGDKRSEMMTVLMEGLTHREAEGQSIAGAKHSFEVMAQAPVTVFVYRPNRVAPWPADSDDRHFSDVVDVQSIGAAIQNMLIAAEEQGLGSLWVCDVFSAYTELGDWLGESTELIAAVCFGYADEHPVARKRKAFADVVHWV